MVNDADLLKYAIENGIINADTIRLQIEMNERKRLLEQHPYAITKGADGYYRTYLPKTNGGRTQLKKKNETDLIDAVIKYWKNEQNNSFKSRFEIWVERQRNCGRSDNTIYKYEADYKRCIEGDEFETLDVRYISEEDISLFIRRLLMRKEIPYKALKALFGYIDGVFRKSEIDKVIKENPCKYVDLPIFKQYCVEPRKKTSEERTVSNKEKKMLLDKLEKNDSPVKYAIEFSMFTGMRVGELAALKWADIDYKHNVINVVNSEKMSRKTKEYVISCTKNGKERKIPLTEDMIAVLKEVKAYSVRNGYISEFVFCDQNGNIHAPRISETMRNYTMTKEFEHTKSIHAIRRTLNSNMKCMGVPTVVASSILGHTEKVNEENYTYDISDMELRRNYIELAGKIV